MQDHVSAVTFNRPRGVTRGKGLGYGEEYISKIKRYGLLEQKEEQDLARLWQENRDRQAAEALVTSHLRLAAKLARRYLRYGFPLADLIAEANLGLVIAASRFEPNRGSRFSTYALWWIRATIHEYILSSWSMVRIGTTAAQRKLFFCLRREMNNLGTDTVRGSPEMAQEVARRVMVRLRDVIEMDCRLSGDVSLNALATDDGQHAIEWEARFADESANAEAHVAEHDEITQRRRALHAALVDLPKRERLVFEARRLNEPPTTLEELGRELCVSAERVRQIEASAFAKVQRTVRGILSQ
ncbi:RNA polymerase factor sigma-32 [Bradyrhizobium sp. Tv2a-2]|uniref:RNA polymerase factor sigma-32 n=1 Tax=Bradyrhizobium sp. Tv2a-2 TaxID=113395 RepID=UPI000464FFBC|nr:RNA polymerase factor sigma-32 [Bradyrhizobium sp. Tv2a-2]